MSDIRKYWWKEMTYGLLLSGAIIGFIKLFNQGQQIQLWATTMTIILSIYIGFALKDKSKSQLLLQIAVAAIFLALTLAGLWSSPWYLVAALILHGFWDLLHDYKIIKTKVMPWYPDFCIVVDWVLGIFLGMDILFKF